MRRALSTKRYLAWLLLLTALAVALCFVPLFNLLGYEFSLSLAVAASLAALHLGSAQVARARQGDEGLVVPEGGGPAALLRLTGRALLANLGLLLLPLGVISLNMLRVKNCDYLEGLAFFALLPSLSVVVATVAGVLWGVAMPRAWLGTVGAIATFFASAAWGVWRFYDAPAIFAYDPFVGYFPGAMYDETVSIGATLLIYRLHNLAWAAGALLLAAALLDPLELRLRLRLRRWWPALAGAPCLLLGLTLFLLRGEIGFAISADQVARELGGVTKTKHFTIHYPARMPPRQVALLKRDHEFRYAQLEAYLGVSPRAIRSFIFASAAQKRRLMGAGRTLIAKPWRGEIYMQDLGFPHRVLKHELAHIFGARFGDPLFGVSLSWRWSPLPHPRFNVGLIEGLAVAADWRPYGDSTAHQYAAALRRLGLAPPLRSLFGAGFLTHAAGRSYTLAGSFCRRLVELYGVQKLKQVYRTGGDFLGVYGRSLPSLLAAWSRWLDAEVQVPERTLQLARERFRRPGIMRRVCGHEIANLRAEARALQGRNEHADAIATYRRICRFEPGDPGHHFELVHALVAAARLDEARAAGQKLLAHPAMSKPLRREVIELLGDMRWWQGDSTAAVRSYTEASGLAAGPGRRRVMVLKRLGASADGEVARLIQRYINPAPDDPRDPGRDVYLAQRIQALLPVEGEGASGLGHYLLAKQLANRRHCDLAAAPVAEAIRLGLPNQDFLVEAYLTQARCLHRRGKLGAAGKALESLAGLSLPNGMVLLVSDWQQRVRWESGDALTPQ